MEISRDESKQQFVVETGNSVSSLGFRDVFEQGVEMFHRLAKKVSGLMPLKKSDIGTVAQYEQYRGLLAQYHILGDKDTWFDGTTPLRVRRVLETARRNGAALRLFLGDAETGRDWLSEFDNIGQVGRSNGVMRTPVLVVDGENTGSILSNCLVRIQDAVTGRELYRHPNYHLPEMRIVDAPSYDVADGFTHNVETKHDNGEWDVLKRFATAHDASFWLAFMSGEVVP